MSDSMGISLSALDVYSKNLDVIANNIANVNTDGFKRQKTTSVESRPAGVELTIRRDTSPGGPIAGNDGQPARESSNVSVADEMVGLITNQQAYDANLKALKTAFEMSGRIVDLLE
jgi:flagellar basal body rod protein FlgG